MLNNKKAKFKLKMSHLIPALALLAVGCGGGGGDPGICKGSAEWCAETEGSASSTPTVTALFVRVPDSTVNTITCLEILDLNSGNKIAFEASAQDAYQRGNLDLDGTPKNGIPCDSYL